MTRKNIAVIRAEAAGLTPAEYPTRLCADCGNRLESIAERLGVTHPRVIALLRQYGVPWRDSRAFEWRGQVDTLSGHCRRRGLSDSHARVIRSRYGMSGADALDKLARSKERS